jgi:hypothetical protein
MKLNKVYFLRGTTFFRCKSSRNYKWLEEPEEKQLCLAQFMDQLMQNSGSPRTSQFGSTPSPGFRSGTVMRWPWKVMRRLFLISPWGLNVDPRGELCPLRSKTLCSPFRFSKQYIESIYTLGKNKGVNFPLGFKVHPWGPTSPLGANVTPWSKKCG